MKKLYSSILIALRIHGKKTGLGKGQGHAWGGSDRGQTMKSGAMSSVDIKVTFWLQYADNREWLSKLILFVYRYANFGRLKLNFSMINILNLADPEIYSLIRNGSETRI